MSKKWNSYLPSGAAVALLSVACFACSPVKDSGAGLSTLPTANAGNSNAAGGASLDSQPADMTAVTERPKVSAFVLDDGDFRLSGARVGLRDYVTRSVPVVTFVPNKNADYVEILRCDNNASISGLGNVDVAIASIDAEAEYFRRQDFWAKAQESTGCVLISSSVSATGNGQGTLFLDPATPAGSWRWLMRACVSPERITDSAMLSGRNCTRFISLTNSLFDYKNEAKEKEKGYFAKAQIERSKADAAARQIFNLTVQYNNSLVHCQDAEKKRQASVMRKKAIADILGLGLSLAGNVLLPEDGLAAVQAGTASFTDLAKKAWDTRDAIAGDGKQISQVLQWLFTSPNDFARTCTEANKIASNGAVLTDQLKAAHQAFAQYMDMAIQAHKANQ